MGTWVRWWLVLPFFLPWLGWTDNGVYDKNDPVISAYQTFANAFVYGRLSEARALAASDRVRQIIQRKEAANAKAGGPRPVVETLFTIISQKTLADGQVKIHGAQVIQFQEPAGEPPVFHRQFITLIFEDGRWLVQDFMDEEEECCK